MESGKERFSILQVIRSRSSIRTFARESVPKETMEELGKLLTRRDRGPFGNICRFGLIDSSLYPQSDLGSISTYGVIKNPYGYLVGAIQKADRSLVDYGYLFQRILLEATRLGLGTCWLGGTFRPEKIASLFPLQPGEIIPAVSPFGIPAEKRSLIDGVLRWGASSKIRKPWGQLFYDASGSSLKEGDCPLFQDALEAVRLAPSAMNRQPWRVVIEGRNAHFFLDTKEDRKYPVRFTELDLGIAMYHFEAVLQEESIQGKWEFSPPRTSYGHPEWEYTASWSS
ncbi:MAG: nitroreductase family protein [Spirochaetes bacterium]|nr:nitroreductase family protein [Spirochaetota bacterium]